MTSPTDTIRYIVDLDDRSATRGLKRLADGMDDVAKLGATLKKSQLAEADAAGKLRVAQARLVDVRKDGKAKASQLAAAEESVHSAQRKLTASTDATRHATASLAKAQDGAEKSSRRLRRTSDDNARGFASVSKSIGGFRVGLGGIAKGAGLAGAAVGLAGGGLLSLGLNAYKGAAQLQAMDQKARIVFGRSFPELERWAKRVSSQFGMTSRRVLGLTAGFADMLVPMGFSRDRAAQMAQKFASLAPVLAQWSGGTFDVQQTTEALTGALTGEYDTLQRLGIPISDAAVQTELLRTKQNKLTGAALNQAKATAALNIIYRGSTDAQKAFAAGQDSLAAKANKAKARFGELRDAILVGLIPVFEKLGDWFVDHQDDIISFGFRAARSFIDFGESGTLALASILDGVGDVMIGLGDFLRTSNKTWAGILTGATMTLGAIFPSMRKRLQEASANFEKFRREAGDDFVSIGQRAKGTADAIRRNVPPAADIARRKLEEVRRAALGLPPNPKINVATPGVDSAISKMNAATRAANGIPDRKWVKVAVDIKGRDVSLGPTRAFPAFGEGGRVPGSAPSDRADNRLIRATPGEWVIQKPTVRKLEAKRPGIMQAINEGRVDVGGDPGMMRLAIDRPIRGQTYAHGGLVPGYADGGLIRRVQSFLQAQHGDTYVYGAAGPHYWDCSGIASGAYGQLTGKGGGSGQRYFTTASIGASQGFRPGRGTFTIGVTAGKGHMAGNLAGLGFEATPPRVRIGARAAKVTSFARQFYLPSAGGVFGGMPGLTNAQIGRTMQLLRPRIIRQIFKELGVRQVRADNGAHLPPRSRTMVENGTNQWEQVGPPGRGTNPAVHVEHFHAHDRADFDLFLAQVEFRERAGQFS